MRLPGGRNSQTFRTYGLRPAMIDLVSEEKVNLARSYTLQPYQFLWLVQKQATT